MTGEVETPELLRALVGQEIATVSGRPNTILGLDGDSVIVATGRSPAGQAVPIAWVDDAIKKVRTDGEFEISVASLGHRSAFVGAVLLTLPEAVLVRGRLQSFHFRSSTASASLNVVMAVGYAVRRRRVTGDDNSVLTHG